MKNKFSKFGLLIKNFFKKENQLLSHGHA